MSGIFTLHYYTFRILYDYLPLKTKCNLSLTCKCLSTFLDYKITLNPMTSVSSFIDTCIDLNPKTIEICSIPTPDIWLPYHPHTLLLTYCDLQTFDPINIMEDTRKVYIQDYNKNIFINRYKLPNAKIYIL